MRTIIEVNMVESSSEKTILSLSVGRSHSSLKVISGSQSQSHNYQPDKLEHFLYTPHNTSIPTKAKTTMSFVSPLQRSKPTISMHPRFHCNRAMNDKQSIEYLNVYTLFLILEKQRNMKLRELYHSKSFVALKKNSQASHEADTTLLKCPPRYQCLDLSAQGLVLEVNKLRRDLSLHISTKEQWKALDRTTKTFLEDTVNVLRYLFDGSGSQTRCSTPPCIPSRTITPHPSPYPLSLTVSEDSMLPHERHSKAMLPQESHSEGRRTEVNMSDDEILWLWNHVVPSVDGFDFDACLGTKKKKSGNK
mmetsp:Transcript_7686/g.12162  ORF Transcript_7686/g.12162 Transcript_7686/m.12162 type:complete len:305 (-) Transcript_7686:884-1798(-)